MLYSNLYSTNCGFYVADILICVSDTYLTKESDLPLIIRTFVNECLHIAVIIIIPAI